MTTTADDLKAARAALTMIQPEPFNAEAPPGALAGDITPTNLHYVRSNFPLPEHDGVLAVAGAVGNPLTLTRDDLRGMPAVEEPVTMECACWLISWSSTSRSRTPGTVTSRSSGCC